MTKTITAQDVTDYLKARQSNPHEYYGFAWANFFTGGCHRELKIQAAEKFELLLQGKDIEPFTHQELRALKQGSLGKKVYLWERQQTISLNELNYLMVFFKSEGFRAIEHWYNSYNQSSNEWEQEHNIRQLTTFISLVTHFFKDVGKKALENLSKQLPSSYQLKFNTFREAETLCFVKEEERSSPQVLYFRPQSKQTPQEKIDAEAYQNFYNSGEGQYCV